MKTPVSESVFLKKRLSSKKLIPETYPEFLQTFKLENLAIWLLLRVSFGISLISMKSQNFNLLINSMVNVSMKTVFHVIKLFWIIFNLLGKWPGSKDEFLTKLCIGRKNSFLFSFYKKRLQHRYFPVNIEKFLRTAILKNICQRLLVLYIG